MCGDVMNEKPKAKPERTPENKALNAPENKALEFPVPKRKPAKKAKKAS